MDTNMAAAPDSAVTEIYQERSYPQFDCVGSYLWIWERLVQAEGSTEAIACQVHRDGRSGRRER